MGTPQTFKACVTSCGTCGRGLTSGDGCWIGFFLGGLAFDNTAQKDLKEAEDKAQREEA